MNLNPDRAARTLRFDLKKQFRSIGQAKFYSPFRLAAKADVPPGITTLLGHSGSGKSTLLSCIAGLISPEEGWIRLDEDALFDAGQRVDVPVSQRRIGYVLQDLALFPHLRAGENIAYGLFQKPVSERRKLVDEIVDAFRIRHIRNHLPLDISGGEQQRVALARALVTEPRVLLLDEPLSALDPATKAGIVDDLKVWISARQIPVLYVTHQREEVFALGHRVLVLENGRIVAQGTPREVLSGHRHYAVAEWSGVENVFDGLITTIHEQHGTMTFRSGAVELEVPLGHAKSGNRVSVGISASDILLATSRPEGLSARNVIPGRLLSLRQVDATVHAIVDCSGSEFEVHLTPAAIQALGLQPDVSVWVVIKTHSCFLISR